MAGTRWKLTPDAGTVEGPLSCEVCGETMTETRNRKVSRSMPESMAGITHLVDLFVCPSGDQVWHKQVVALRQAAADTPSSKLADMFREEAFDIVVSKRATKEVGLWSVMNG